MTTVAWDGKTLAADRQRTDHNCRTTGTKIGVISGVGLFALSGNGAYGAELVEWATNGFKPDQYPRHESDKEATLLLLRADGRASIYSGKFPVPVLDQFIVLGTGGDFALAAMHCGKTAVEAVLLASQLDIYTGMGIDSLTLDSV